ncbi:MAG TPA: exodeoxyribonuclease VII small subunit [Syntrophomonadaceae bacterium]|nr:exodeoxyribonuclease VII small subunit [Syntrophomonadaceae bacterium]
MDDMKFEQALKRLEDIVESIESGKLDLDESIKLFEEGMRLSAHCQKKLQMADAKIKYLISDEESGELNLVEES